MNLVSAKEVILSPSHLAIVMEYCAGGNLTSYVTDKWDSTDERNGLFLSEDEARYFFRVSLMDPLKLLNPSKLTHPLLAAIHGCGGLPPQEQGCS